MQRQDRNTGPRLKIFDRITAGIKINLGILSQSKISKIYCSHIIAKESFNCSHFHQALRCAGANALEWFYNIYVFVHSKDLAATMMICWRLWNHRNEVWKNTS